MDWEYVKSTLSQAMWWTEICLDPEDNCKAFRDHAIAHLRDAIRVIPETETELRDHIGRAIGYLAADGVYGAVAALQQALTLVEVKCHEARKEAAASVGAAAK